MRKKVFAELDKCEKTDKIIDRASATVIIVFIGIIFFGLVG